MSTDPRDVPTTVRRKRAIKQARDMVDAAEQRLGDTQDRLDRSKVAIDESIDRLNGSR